MYPPVSKRARINGDDAEVGQAAIAIDPVVEKPCQVAVGLRLDQLLHVVGVFVVGGFVVVQGGVQCGFADHVAQHPPDVHGLGLHVEVVGGIDEGVFRWSAGARILLFGCEQRVAMALKIIEDGWPAAALLQEGKLRVMGEAVVNPRARGREVEVRQLLQGGEQQRAVFRPSSGISSMLPLSNGAASGSGRSMT